MEYYRQKQMFRYSENLSTMSSESIEQLKEEIEVEPEPRGELLDIALGRIAFELKWREGQGN